MWCHATDVYVLCEISTLSHPVLHLAWTGTCCVSAMHGLRVLVAAAVHQHSLSTPRSQSGLLAARLTVLTSLLQLQPAAVILGLCCPLFVWRMNWPIFAYCTFKDSYRMSSVALIICISVLLQALTAEEILERPEREKATAHTPPGGAPTGDARHFKFLAKRMANRLIQWHVCPYNSPF